MLYWPKYTPIVIEYHSQLHSNKCPLFVNIKIDNYGIKINRWFAI